MKSTRWRIILSVLVFILALAYALPNIPAIGNSGLSRFLPSAQINLGLDLKGGMDLTLGVDMQTAINTQLSSIGQDIQYRAEQDGLIIARPSLGDNSQLTVILTQKSQDSVLNELFSNNYPNLTVRKDSETDSTVTYNLEFSAAALAEIENLTMDQVVHTIRNRIDQFGVAEPDIRRQSDNQVQVQLPGLTDPARAMQIVGQTAHLEFRLARLDVDPNSMLLPPGVQIFPSQEDIGGQSRVALGTDVLMTGEDITNARPTYDERGRPQVAIEFSSHGATMFERITGEHAKEYLAIVLDGVVYSIPQINERISGGRAVINGTFTVEQANDLAVVLRAGSLPAPVTVLEERTVGPSLGQDSINSGLRAALVGALLVIAAMPLYYGTSGVISDVMLAFTMLILMAGLAVFGAALTMPGIAGIVLTIGMAVDANVLIYERIREEIKNGHSPGEAVDLGFSRATIAIMDSNLTTVIAAAVLYIFGTGPVRGFAVTLTLGIVGSLFTAIFVSRTIFQTWMRRNGGAKISI